MSKYTIGIDLGGTTMTAGLVDENYKIIGKTTWATRLPRPAEELEKALADLCRTVAKENKVDFTDVKYVGIGTPGSVNFTTGFVGFNTNFGYYDWNLGPDLEAMLGCKVYVENDANAAAYGEYIAGGAKGYKDAVVITLGTGIGTALIYNGVLIPNTELGHIILSAKHLDAEKYASSAIRENEELGYKKWAKRLTKYYSLIEKYFSPSLIVIGGGVSRKSDNFVPFIDIARRRSADRPREAAQRGRHHRCRLLRQHQVAQRTQAHTFARHTLADHRPGNAGRMVAVG